jgi:hypothetical membrane protein
MSKLLIRQAIYMPIVYFGTIIIASLFATDYSHIGQHASELAVNTKPMAGIIFNVGIFITGLLLVLYGIGLLLKFKLNIIITSLLICVFGVTFLFGAFYKIGSPWHGLYGIGLSIMMLPFAFLFEVGKEKVDRVTKTITIIVALAIFIYFWAMVARLDPMELRGLTQRIFGIFVFGFISYSAHKLNGLNEL